MRVITFCLFLLSATDFFGQFAIESMMEMPTRVSNNAIASGVNNGNQFVYSFGGLDSTKNYAGIHSKVYRYDVSQNNWDSIGILPNPTGRIAAGASTVKNKIYIIGGYEVKSNGSETSFEDVHIFDPETNGFLNDGTPIPVPIDDQVQCVYKDSLIFVVTGWSNNTNVSNVQIYNPSEDTWTEGTSVPPTIDYKVFGASGTIIGDTIYYAGGARIGSTFPATDIFRKGYINPDNPAEITWTHSEDDLAIGYRMAAFDFKNQAIWFGGSQTTYNYNGIAYNGSGPVAAEDRILVYNPNLGSFSLTTDALTPLMDLRGIAQISPTEFIVAGGMEPEQKVTDQTWKITIDLPSSVPDLETKQKLYQIFPNPASNFFTIKSAEKLDITFLNITGQILNTQSCEGNCNFDLNNFDDSCLILQIEAEEFVWFEKLFITHD